MAYGSRLTGVSLEWVGVPVAARTQNRIRAMAAWLCLLAVVLLYAPLAGAAWLAHGMECCAGGYCPITAHHHHTQQNVPSRQSSPMDCGHDSTGLTSCSMSCCPDTTRPALLPVAFLLPAVIFVPATEEVSRPGQVANSLEISRSIKPLSPPPRFSSPVR